MWPKFCHALDREDLTNDERFEVNADRVENRVELDQILDEEFAQYSTAEAVARMEDAGVPASRVRDMEDVFENPQVQARNMHQTVDLPTIGSMEMAGSPMHFSRTPTVIERHPPLLGEHTKEILTEFGYDDEMITELADRDII
nr:CoA transferase [Halostagnicola sp. A56]